MSQYVPTHPEMQAVCTYFFPLISFYHTSAFPSPHVPTSLDFASHGGDLGGVLLMQGNIGFA